MIEYQSQFDIKSKNLESVKHIILWVFAYFLGSQ